MRTTVIATGGTIAWDANGHRMLSGGELLDAAGETADEVIDLQPVPSWDMSVANMVEIAQRVRSAVEAGSEAVVVLHGTDAMEESAWLTELSLGAQAREHAAVLFTGAMRFADHPHADGPANVTWALRAGREPGTAGRGVQVAWPRQLHAARWARKVDAAAANPFESGPRQTVGHRPPEPGPAIEQNVALVKVGPLARPAVPAAVAGVVLEGMGAAHVPSEYHPIIEDLLAGGVPVVLASRCRDVLRGPAAGDGVLYAGDLTAEKAAIALMVGLGRKRDLTDLRAWWSELLTASGDAVSG
jgi:L-asparaginase